MTSLVGRERELELVLDGRELELVLDGFEMAKPGRGSVFFHYWRNELHKIQAAVEVQEIVSLRKYHDTGGKMYPTIKPDTIFDDLFWPH